MPTQLARVISQATSERLHHETVKALLSRSFFWHYEEFRDLINYPVHTDPQARRMEMVKLCAQGWSEQTVAQLLRSARVRDPREGPPVSRRPFEYAYIDIRYLDAKPEGVQLYSTL